MPAAFDDCVAKGGSVRTVSGPNKAQGLKEGEYVHYCYLGGKSYRGEVKTKKQANNDGGQVDLKAQSVAFTIQKAGELRTQELGGRQYLEVPCIILSEGVLHSSNSDHPALALAEEFLLFPASWNGRPIVYDHPKNNEGEPVPANSPGVWENGVIGYLFGTMPAANNTKLLSYLWLDKQKTPKEALDTLNSGGVLEVSTGLWCLEEQTSGTYTDGKDYSTIWRNIVPDHLAVLPPGTIGACSVADGCGAPRVNSQGAAMDPDPKQKPNAELELNEADEAGLVCNVLSTARTPSYDGTEKTAWSRPSLSAYVEGYNQHKGGSEDVNANVSSLSAAAKSWIASKTLLGDPSADTRRDLIFFPVVNPRTNNLNEGALRAVLGGRGTQANIPEAARSSAQDKARSLLKSQFNVDLSANEAGCDCPKLEGSAEKPGLFKRLSAGFLSVLGFKTNDLSDSDRRTAVESALSSSVDAPTSIVSLYPSKVVYAQLNKQDYSIHIYQRSYSVAEGGAVTLKSDIQEVRPETQYVPLEVVVNQLPGATMDPKDPKNLQNADAGTGKPADGAQPAQPAKPAEPVKANSLDELKAHASPEVQKQLEQILAANKARQDTLIKALEGKVGLSADELKSLPLEQLEKMATAMNVNSQAADYSGAAGGGGGSPEDKDKLKAQEQYTPARPVFELPASATKQ